MDDKDTVKENEKQDTSVQSTKEQDNDGVIVDKEKQDNNGADVDKEKQDNNGADVDKDDVPNAINLLIVGRDGNGKTCSANSIMGQKIFERSPIESGKIQCQKKSQTVDGRFVTIIDVSGLKYPDIDADVGPEKPYEKKSSEGGNTKIDASGPDNSDINAGGSSEERYKKKSSEEDDKKNDVSSLENSDIDADVGPEKRYEKNFSELEEVIKETKAGFHAVLIVLQYGVRFTKQEKDAITMIKSTFGEDVIRKFGVIVMTHGDYFEQDEESECRSFEEFCKLQTGDFQKLYDECKGRCVLLNNRGQDDENAKKQREELFEIVDKIKTQDSYEAYTDKDYRSINRSEILVRAAYPRIKKEMTNKFATIRSTLHNADFKTLPPFKQRSKLDDLKEKLNKIKVSLEKEDKNTNILQLFLQEMEILEASVKLKLKIVSLTKKQDGGFEMVNKDEVPPPDKLPSSENNKASKHEKSGYLDTVQHYTNQIRTHHIYQRLFGKSQKK